ncbi:hypothetical protein [Thermofilum pendens]
MAVRVRLVNEEAGRSVVVRVLVNGGAESEEPVVAVTPDVAREVGLDAR